MLNKLLINIGLVMASFLFAIVAVVLERSVSAGDFETFVAVFFILISITLLPLASYRFSQIMVMKIKNKFLRWILLFFLTLTLLYFFWVMFLNVRNLIDFLTGHNNVPVVNL